MSELDPNSQFTPLPPLDPSEPTTTRPKWWDYLKFWKSAQVTEPAPSSIAQAAPAQAVTTEASPAAPGASEASPAQAQTKIQTHSAMKLVQKHKNWLAGAAIFVGVILGISFVHQPKEEVVIEEPTKRGQAGTVLPNIDRDRENWIVRSDALFQRQQKDIEDLKKSTENDHKQLDDLIQAIKNSGGTISNNPDGTVSLKLPQPEKDPSPVLPPAPKPAPAPQLPQVPPPPIPGTEGLQPAPSIPEPALAPTIRSFKPAETSALVSPGGVKPVGAPATTGVGTGQTIPGMLTQQRIGIREDDIWIPSGTFIKARLLSGVMAPTGARASQSPHPVLLELMEDGIAPNHNRVPTKGCFVVASAVGDLSSERAMLRTETLSCVRDDKSTVDSELRGTVADENGINGIRGTLVSKQGGLLAQSLLAGFAKGISDVMRYQSTNIMVGPGGMVSSIDPSQAVRGGALGGVSNSMDRLAQFYVELANEIFPVIEVSAGRTVDVIVTRGFVPL